MCRQMYHVNEIFFEINCFTTTNLWVISARCVPKNYDDTARQSNPLTYSPLKKLGWDQLVVFMKNSKKQSLLRLNGVCLMQIFISYTSYCTFRYR
jgi:hypothetical protein